MAPLLVSNVVHPSTSVDPHPAATAAHRPPTATTLGRCVHQVHEPGMANLLSVGSTVLLISWIYKSRDATGGKFPLNSCDKFRCCFCQLFEILVRNEIRVESSKYSRNLEFSASSRFDSIYIQISYKYINSVHACMAMHACMHAWLERTNGSFHGII